MHPMLLTSVIRRCRERQEAGDCAGPNQTPVEQLEDAIVQLAADAERARQQLPPLTEAMYWAVRGLEFTVSGEAFTLRDEDVDLIWDAINTSLRVLGTGGQVKWCPINGAPCESIPKATRCSGCAQIMLSRKL